MENKKFKPAVRFGLVGLVVSTVVVWLAGLATDSELVGEGAPMFGPFSAGSIFIVAMAVVGAIIGAYKKR